MTTLNLKEAAQFLKIHPITLSRLAAHGQIPAAKTGKKWIFITVDLLDWLRAKYAMQVSLSDSHERKTLCHSSGAKTHLIGGSNLLHRTDDAYSKALGLPKK
ncbi:helix-turn-helix domain-containing protein [Undibacterium oligocarboniphilum]|uniref:Helix-turn-helix domain-containing protein n=1 Tax=Undibacterium oligocarboniphilum TaxID=666702 RepID=A0A850QT46_9BURK|nr:helix-turn-helix domain-containing protein [Undibacterium oligocarboniphilum]NVO79196.1 helix-turn-helix domain-containing protein [Undibacterium oligocarboniphilum]